MSITVQEALQRTIEHREIFHDEMLSLMRQIMSGEVTPVMIAALTVGLRVKKETIGEIAAAAQVMREFATKVDVADRDAPGRHRRHRRRRVAHVQHLDGVDVRRGGGRRARGQARRPLGVVEVGQRRRAGGARRQHHAEARRRSRTCIAETGIGFMFAPQPPRAMKHAAPVRKELGVRTIFNILGPLTNPGRRAQPADRRVPPGPGRHPGARAAAARREHVLVVYGKDGMDEVSLGAATMVGELKDGEVREYEIHPEDFGLSMISNRGLKVADAAESKEMVLEALGNVEGTPREIVTLNAGAALYAANVAASIGEGIERARAAIASGAAKRKLDAVRRDDAEARAGERLTAGDVRDGRHPRADPRDQGARRSIAAQVRAAARRGRCRRARADRRRAISRARCARRIAAGRPAVIAEIKKASPSKGVLRADLRSAGDRRALRARAAPRACRC